MINVTVNGVNITLIPDTTEDNDQTNDGRPGTVSLQEDSVILTSFTGTLQLTSLDQLPQEANEGVVTEGGNSSSKHFLHEVCAEENIAAIPKLRTLLKNNAAWIAARREDAGGNTPLSILGKNKKLLCCDDVEEAVSDLLDVYRDAILKKDIDKNIPFVGVIKEWTRSLEVETDFSESKEVERAFELLSLAFDQFSRPISTNNRRNTRQSQLKNRKKIAKCVAFIPDIFTTILSIKNDDARSQIMDLSVVRRAFFSYKSFSQICVLNDLTREESQKFVDYMVLVSSIGEVDFVGEGRKVLPDDVNDFKKAERSFLERALPHTEQLLRFMLLKMPWEKLQRVSTTKFISQVLNEWEKRRIVASLKAIDFLFHLMMIVAFRAKIAKTSRALIDSSLELDEGYDVATIMIYSIAFHYLIRGAIVGIKLDISYFFSFWKVTDSLSILLTVTSTSLLIWDIDFPILFIATMGLLWLKLLGFLKGIHLQLAKFILSVTEIVKSLHWFLVVFALGIFMFADMIHIATTHHKSGELCLPEDLIENSAIEDFCSSDLVNSYIRMYSVWIGDFSFVDYQSSTVIVILYILFTLIGVIVLLNVLIAIVSNSYEKSSERSKYLFGQARMFFAAEYFFFEEFIYPPLQRSEGVSLVKYGVHWFVYFCIVLSIIGTAVLVDLFLFNDIILPNIGKGGSLLFFMIFGIILCLVHNVSVVAVLYYSIFVSCRSEPSEMISDNDEKSDNDVVGVGDKSEYGTFNDSQSRHTGKKTGPAPSRFQSLRKPEKNSAMERA